MSSSSIEPGFTISSIATLSIVSVIFICLFIASIFMFVYERPDTTERFVTFANRPTERQSHTVDIIVKYKHKEGHLDENLDRQKMLRVITNYLIGTSLPIGTSWYFITKAIALDIYSHLNAIGVSIALSHDDFSSLIYTKGNILPIQSLSLHPE